MLIVENSDYGHREDDVLRAINGVRLDKSKGMRVNKEMIKAECRRSGEREFMFVRNVRESLEGVEREPKAEKRKKYH